MDRTKPERVTTIGHNIGPTKDKVASAAKQIIELEKQRSQVNAEMAEVRSAVEALGIPKRAFAATIQYLKLDADQRAGLDQGYVLAREAVGLPVQGVMFDLAPAKEEQEAA